MPGRLNVSQGKVMMRLLVDLGLGVPAETGTTPWQVGYEDERDKPDQVITAFSTEGLRFAANHSDLEKAEREGVQVRVRGRTADEAWKKMQDIDQALKAVDHRQVNVDQLSFVVKTVRRESGPMHLPLPLRKDKIISSERKLVVANYLCVIRQRT